MISRKSDMRADSALSCGSPSGTLRQAQRGSYRLLIDELEMPVTLGTEVLIGRASDCHLLLKSGLVSRHHARVRYSSEGLTVEDLKSRNGVVVNGLRIDATTALRHGDVVGVGLKSIQVLDDAVPDRPEHLSTLPPTPSLELSVRAEHDAGEATVRVQLDHLSKRERDVLTLIVRGLTHKEMAQRLFVSVKTVETYRARLAEKLGCQSRAELVTYAIAAGILRDPSP